MRPKGSHSGATSAAAPPPPLQHQQQGRAPILSGVICGGASSAPSAAMAALDVGALLAGLGLQAVPMPALVAAAVLVVALSLVAARVLANALPGKKPPVWEGLPFVGGLQKFVKVRREELCGVGGCPPTYFSALTATGRRELLARKVHARCWWGWGDQGR